MVWAVGDVAASSFADNADVTPPMPTHAPGQILLAAPLRRNQAAGASISETGSWVELYDDIGVGLYGLEATSSSETAPTFQFAGGSAGDTTGAVVFTTTGGSLTVEDSDGLDNSTSTDVTFPGLTIPQACLVIEIACINDNLSFNHTAGWTELVDTPSTEGDDMAIGIQYQITSSNTSSHVGTISISRGSQTASIALQEAALSNIAAVLRRRRI